ncbi:hypothetical protein ACFFQF_31045 [Haladaptatus pallidirubidus]|uniref:DUF7982 domain-containing protein n=1 Tax=Haladaptatus pallidirubidus TaxID=1008152 RepID=A0AAV3UH91_9EURY|nr:hypothetical protein [Haladaptatus pallidirubidus]
MSKQEQTLHDDQKNRSDQTVAKSELEDLQAQLDILAEENARLRTAYRRSKQVEYRNTALGLAAIGLICGLGAFLFPESQTVLLALAGCGGFGAILTYYLTPEQVVPASIGERTYSAFATTYEALSAELGLQDTTIYVPNNGASPQSFADIRLFRPQHARYQLPNTDALTSVLVVTENELEHGLSLYPSGAALLTEFEKMTGDLPSELDDLAGQLAETLTHGFELVDDASVENIEAGQQITVSIAGSTYGSITRLDHPVSSFLGSGLADQLQEPVTVETVQVEDERSDYLITCSWDEGNEET